MQRGRRRSRSPRPDRSRRHGPHAHPAQAGHQRRRDSTSPSPNPSCGGATGWARHSSTTSWDARRRAGQRPPRPSRIGLRTLSMVQKPDDQGASFNVELNGVPVFMKGANYIPNDTFCPRVTRAKYERMVRSAADTHMNMLRVWGGGIYEDDVFYDLCDEHGILVWQEFVFACADVSGRPGISRQCARRKRSTMSAACATTPASRCGAATMRSTPPGRMTCRMAAGAGSSSYNRSPARPALGHL